MPLWFFILPMRVTGRAAGSRVKLRRCRALDPAALACVGAGIMKNTQNSPSIASINRLEANYQLLFKKGAMKAAPKTEDVTVKVQPCTEPRMCLNRRYSTSGIVRRLPLSVRMKLWELVDRRFFAGEDMDYLQVFELSNDFGKLKVEHRQEVPPYKNTIWLSNEPLIKAKIFVIDNGEYTTMLLADEY